MKKSYIFTQHQLLEDCEIDFYDKESFKEVMQKNAIFTNEIVKYLNHNSVKIYGRIACLAEKNARGKVADMFCALLIIYLLVWNLQFLFQGWI